AAAERDGIFGRGTDERQGVRVVIDEMCGPNPVSRRRHPPELAAHGFAFVAHTAREDIGVVSERAEDLRQLRGMAERVGDIRDAGGAPELACAPQPLLKIANDRLARDQEKIRQDMPRADEEAIGSYERRDTGHVGGSLLEIVLDGDRLTVEGERAEAGIALEEVEEARDHRDEPRAVALEALVPLAIPVLVRDQECGP